MLAGLFLLPGLLGWEEGDEEEDDEEGGPAADEEEAEVEVASALQLQLLARPCNGDASSRGLSSRRRSSRVAPDLDIVVVCVSDYAAPQPSPLFCCPVSVKAVCGSPLPVLVRVLPPRATWCARVQHTVEEVDSCNCSWGHESLISTPLPQRRDLEGSRVLWQAGRSKPREQSIPRPARPLLKSVVACAHLAGQLSLLDGQ